MICLSFKIVELGWLKRDLQGFSYMSCSQNTMSPINCEMNQGWISYLFGCHGLVEIRGYPRIEKIPWS